MPVRVALTLPAPLTVRRADSGPTAEGVNVMEITQVPPASRVALLQASAVTAKSAAFAPVRLVASVPLVTWPVLVIVKSSGALA